MLDQSQWPTFDRANPVNGLFELGAHMSPRTEMDSEYMQFFRRKKNVCFRGHGPKKLESVGRQNILFYQKFFFSREVWFQLTFGVETLAYQ